MKVDSGGYAETVSEAADAIADAERAGFDGAWVAETKLDPFLAMAVAADRTERIELITAIAVAFARNPMTVATQANDVQRLSAGRFRLGLGSQIEPHITKRFSMPWSSPAARMREFVLAVRAIWRAWETGDRLAFRGEFYKHTLMTPFFDPGPNPHGNPKIYVAAVGPRMTEVAGEVADGLLCHSFITERYLREVALPAVERGRAKAGKDLAGFDLSVPPFVATTPAELADVKEKISFYGSTPAYRAVLDLHGWGDLQDELHALSRRGKWAEMPALISADVLAAFAVVGSAEEVAAEVRRRFGDIAQRLTLPEAAFRAM
ncbi:PROBABLE OXIDOREDUCTASE [Alloactinosynnema sp. L-07]|uniref:TIGR03617 family F420-dependent LLM class oxidoreductase n=1 Tax=Alloactinosynnema sp. L-07 TaxID=1653480 RepID=UPI00065EF4E2|nr:TIGR03617 family F420-dependent LLM class oxidoreductase [Alloactinosynnema sp. L-07]CRK61117.1 PROBABLE OXIDOREDUCTASE [Alloactinosynnema sp. L-07]